MEVSRRSVGAWAGLVVATVLAVASAAWGVPFWGAKESRPADTDPAALRPGEFVWEGGTVARGPIVVAVSLEEQRAYVYRNGIRIGFSRVSTGKPGFATPTGVFTVLQKDKDHRSKTYNNAPMPFTERLTWGGVALHAGGLPGYPSSHGCVHLPSAFAERLFEISPMGMVVVIADEHSDDEHVRYPAAIAPIDAKTGADVEKPRLGATEEQRWTPEAAPAGPVSILVSGADRRVLVFRNGVEIGRAKIEVRGDGPLGTHAFVLLDPATARPTATGRRDAEPRWIAVAVPGHEVEKGRVLDHVQADRVVMPPDFTASLRASLQPGDTLMVTDGAVLEHTTGTALTVVTADPPAEPSTRKEG